jgi:hypothetical protein
LEPRHTGSLKVILAMIDKVILITPNTLILMSLIAIFAILF